MTTSSIRGFQVRSSAPVLAMLDTMKLVHLGSTVEDDRLLSEGRKKFIAATNFLRWNASLKDPEIPPVGLMLVSMGISLSEVCSIFVVSLQEFLPIPRYLSTGLLLGSLA